MLPLLELHERKLTNTKGKKSAIKSEQQLRKESQNHLDLHTKNFYYCRIFCYIHAWPWPPIVTASTVPVSPLPGKRGEKSKKRISRHNSWWYNFISLRLFRMGKAVSGWRRKKKRAVWEQIIISRSERSEDKAHRSGFRASSSPSHARMHWNIYNISRRARSESKRRRKTLFVIKLLDDTCSGGCWICLTFFRYLSCCSSFSSFLGRGRLSVKHFWVQASIISHRDRARSSELCINILGLPSACASAFLSICINEHTLCPPISNNKHREPFFRRKALDAENRFGCEMKATAWSLSRTVFLFEADGVKCRLIFRRLELTVMHGAIGRETLLVEDKNVKIFARARLLTRWSLSLRRRSPPHETGWCVNVENSSSMLLH